MELGIDIPVIVISSYLSENMLDNAIKQGVVRCINKPFQIEDILNDVEHITLAFKA